MLVEKGLLSKTELAEALVEQRQRRGGRLGEILVERGYLSGPALASVLAEQHGVDLGTGDEPNDNFETVKAPPQSSAVAFKGCGGREIVGPRTLWQTSGVSQRAIVVVRGIPRPMPTEA